MSSVSTTDNQPPLSSEEQARLLNEQNLHRDYAKQAFPDKPRRGWLDFNLGGLTKAFRYATGGSTEDKKGIPGAPLIGVGLTGLGLGALGYYAGPWIERVLRRTLSPKFGGKESDEDDDFNHPESEEHARKFWMWGIGGNGALIAAGLNLNSDRPWYGFKHYSPMYKASSAIPKKADAWNSMTLAESMRMIHDNPGLTPEMRMQAMQLLGSFDAPPSTTINGGDLVGQAIATGQSAASGMAVGYLTASLLGLPNPKSTAILGAVANTLGPSAALTASMVFGH